MKPDKNDPRAVNAPSEDDISLEQLHDIEAAAKYIEYISVPLSNLQVDTVTGFNLYLKSGAGQNFVLYRGANLPFGQEQKEKLQESDVREVYITASDRKHYLRYLEENLGNIIADESLSTREKTRIAYDCASQLARDVLRDPSRPENLERAKAMVGHTVHHLITDVEQPATMLDMMAFDYSTYTHSVNVCILGIALGERLGLSSEELNVLGAGLFLHDVGKSKVDPAILNKKGPLDDREWETIKKHPDLGYEILREAGGVPEAAMLVVRQHHEKMNGKGYPLGLQDQEIHLYAKIAALADVFDALTTKRAYKDALRSFPAVKIMRDEMAEEFKPEFLRELILMLSDAKVPKQSVGLPKRSKAPKRRAA